MILLAVYNPRLPRLGPGQKAALLGVDDEVKTNIRSLCGMALSNRKTPPHMITACMGISMCESRASLFQSISPSCEGLLDEELTDNHDRRREVYRAYGTGRSARHPGEDGTRERVADGGGADAVEGSLGMGGRVIGGTSQRYIAQKTPCDKWVPLFPTRKSLQRLRPDIIYVA